MDWKKGRGKLGLLKPLLGKWVAHADSEMGLVECERIFVKSLDDAYITLNANWDVAGKPYKEMAMIGVNSQKQIGFWSFTSDGKQSQGLLVDAPEIHPQAIVFEANMPAGIARMAYWPDEAEGFRWVVESKNKKGWNRFVEHHYLSV